jgi:hypothetical protein
VGAKEQSGRTWSSFHLTRGTRVKVASVTYFPRTERGVNSPDRKVGEGAPSGRGGRGWMKGGKLGGSRCGSVMR